MLNNVVLSASFVCAHFVILGCFCILGSILVRDFGGYFGVIAYGYACLFPVELVLVFVSFRLWFALLVVCYCLCCIWV